MKVTLTFSDNETGCDVDTEFDPPIGEDADAPVTPALTLWMVSMQAIRMYQDGDFELEAEREGRALDAL